MKAKVQNSFVDKYTGEVYEVGQTIEVTEDRFKEINDTFPDLVKKVTTKKQKGE